MAAIKKLITAFIIGLIVGVWMGVNIGKKQPIWSNPFKEEQKKITRRAKEKVGDVIKDTKKAIRDKLDDGDSKNKK
jgi:hypothetical protein